MTMTPVQCPSSGQVCTGGAPGPDPLCPKGFYCPNSSEPAIACPDGLTTLSEGSTSQGQCTCEQQGYYLNQTTGDCAICPGGYYCPVSATSTTICPPGAYCPEGSGSPIDASVGFYTPGGLAYQIPCTPGTLCPGGRVSEPTPCPEGYTCPTFDGAPVECPFGYVCNTGKPRRCVTWRGVNSYPGDPEPVLQVGDREYCPGKALGPQPCPHYSISALLFSGTLVPYCVCASRDAFALGYEFYYDAINGGEVDGVSGSETLRLENGTISCTPCPANTYAFPTSEPVAGWSLMPSTCLPCITNTHTGVGEGYWTRFASPLYGCVADPGYVMNSTGGLIPCPINTFHPHPGDVNLLSPEYCEPCPGNSAAPPGSTSCDSCLEGWAGLPYCDTSQGGGSGGGLGDIANLGSSSESVTMDSAAAPARIWTVVEPTQSNSFMLSTAGTLWHSRADQHTPSPMWTKFDVTTTNAVAASGRTNTAQTFAEYYAGGLAMSQDGSKMYTIVYSWTVRDDRSVMVFTFSTPSSTVPAPSPLNTWGSWSSVSPVAGGSMLPHCNVAVNVPAGYGVDINSLVRDGGSQERFYFSSMYCTGYMDIDGAGGYLWTVVATWSNTVSSGSPNAIEGNIVSGGASMRFYDLFGGITNALQIFPWREGKFAAMAGGVPGPNQPSCPTTQHQSVTAVYVMDYTTNVLTMVSGMQPQSCTTYMGYGGTVPFKLPLPVIFGAGSSSRLLRGMGFIPDPMDTDSGYLLHGPLISSVNLVTGEVLNVSDPRGVLPALESHTTNEDLIAGEVGGAVWSWFTASINKQSQADITVREAFFSARYSSSVRIACDSNRDIIRGTCPEPACAPVHPETNNPGCTAGQKLGVCTGTTWSCTTCPRELGAGVAAPYFEEYVLPGGSCETR